MMYCYAFIVILLSIYRTESLDFKGRIAKGYNASPGMFPYVVRLEVKRKSSHSLCGGTLIDAKWILTAAHCVVNIKSIDILLGVVAKNEPHFTRSVKSSAIIIHPNWDEEYNKNDIALIKIPKFTVSSLIFPVRLPSAATQSNAYYYRMCTVAGWGQKGDSGASSNYLQWARMHVISNEECANYFDHLTENEVCVRSKGCASPCLGDSGGPVVLAGTGELIGVISAMSDEGCENNEPNIAMSVSEYMPWIHSKIGRL